MLLAFVKIVGVLLLLALTLGLERIHRIKAFNRCDTIGREKEGELGKESERILKDI